MTDVSCQVRWSWRMTTDVRLPSGLTRTVLFFFLWRESIFWEKMKKKFSENRATQRPRRHSTCLPCTAGGMHSQNKHDRHTDSRFSLLEDNWPRDGRGSQDQGSTWRRSWETFVSNWIWEEHMKSLFISTLNKYCVHTACYVSLQSCMWGATTNALIHIYICWGDMYGYIYITPIYICIHTHTHTHTYC
jgi:hypothetical protein